MEIDQARVTDRALVTDRRRCPLVQVLARALVTGPAARTVLALVTDRVSATDLALVIDLRRYLPVPVLETAPAARIDRALATDRVSVTARCAQGRAIGRVLVIAQVLTIDPSVPFVPVAAM